MARHSFQTRALGEVEKLLPGFRGIWARIKSECGTRIRCPRSVAFTDDPSPLILDDSDSCKRFALDLETMALSHSVHASAGEWACHAGRNNDETVSVRGNAALLTCVYNDYYRTFSLTVQVAKLPGHVSGRVESNARTESERDMASLVAFADGRV